MCEKPTPSGVGWIAHSCKALKTAIVLCKENEVDISDILDKHLKQQNN